MDVPQIYVFKVTGFVFHANTFLQENFQHLKIDRVEAKPDHIVIIAYVRLGMCPIVWQNYTKIVDA